MDEIGFIRFAREKFLFFGGQCHFWDKQYFPSSVTVSHKMSYIFCQSSDIVAIKYNNSVWIFGENVAVVWV